MTITITPTTLDISTEMVSYLVTLKGPGGKIDPTGIYTPYFAWTIHGTAKPGSDFTALEWHAGTWDTGAGKYWAEAKLGSKHGGVVLADGDYDEYLALDGPADAPVWLVGRRKIK